MNDAARSSNERPLSLIKRAIGDRKAIRSKLERAAFTLKNYAHYERVNERLEKLRALGYLDQVPNRTQLVFGTVDMFRFFFVPARADYHERTDTLSFRFHLLLRILEDPAALMDPTGFVSHRDTIIGHVMRIVHCDPIYDLQVLAAIPEGLEQLERQLEQMLDGTHPRHDAISAIIEDPEYHARLLAHVREFRANPHGCARLLRDNVVDNPDFLELAEVFGDLPSTMAYFASLPEKPLEALLRLIDTWQEIKPPRAMSQEPAANEAGPDTQVEAA